MTIAQTFAQVLHDQPTFQTFGFPQWGIYRGQRLVVDWQTLKRDYPGYSSMTFFHMSQEQITNLAHQYEWTACQECGKVNHPRIECDHQTDLRGYNG